MLQCIAFKEDKTNSISFFFPDHTSFTVPVVIKGTVANQRGMIFLPFYTVYCTRKNIQMSRFFYSEQESTYARKLEKNETLFVSWPTADKKMVNSQFTILYSRNDRNLKRKPSQSTVPLTCFQLTCSGTAGALLYFLLKKRTLVIY